MSRSTLHCRERERDPTTQLRGRERARPRARLKSHLGSSRATSSWSARRARRTRIRRCLRRRAEGAAAGGTDAVPRRRPPRRSDDAHDDATPPPRHRWSKARARTQPRAPGWPSTRTGGLNPSFERLMGERFAGAPLVVVSASQRLAAASATATATGKTYKLVGSRVHHTGPHHPGSQCRRRRRRRHR
jgi:hypothetical protein